MAKSLAFCYIVLMFRVCLGSILHHSLKLQNGGSRTVELWCVAKNNADDASLQSALDWACGPGGVDCGPVQPTGPCYDSTDIQTTASFVFNDYFLKHGMTDDSCYFQNSAALTSLNPSHGNCKFPSSLTVSNGSFSSPVTALGLEPKEDLSGSDSSIDRVLGLITSHLLIVIAWNMLK